MKPFPPHYLSYERTPHPSFDPPTESHKMGWTSHHTLKEQTTFKFLEVKSGAIKSSKHVWIKPLIDRPASQVLPA